MSSRAALALVLLIGCGRTARVPASAPSQKIVVLTDADRVDSLWSVSTDRTVHRLDWPPGGSQWSFESESGSDRMKPSPDGARVAYIEKRALAIRELTTGRTTILQRAAADTEIAITDWSPKSDALLYATLPHPAPAPDAEADVFGDDPTYHRVDLTTGRTTKVMLPGIYAGWLASDEIVVTSGGGQKLIALRDGSARVIAETNFDYGQLRVSSDGMHIVATASRTDGGKTTEVVLAIDPTTGRATPLTAPTGFAEQEWPALSPSNKRLAYLRTAHLPSGRTTEALVVDGRELSNPSSELVGFTWLDDDAIVLQRTDGLVVMAVRP